MVLFNYDNPVFMPWCSWKYHANNIVHKFQYHGIFQNTIILQTLYHDTATVI